jgi:predicted MPP superfamily phosphohydrolase
MISSIFINRSKPGVFETPWFVILTWVGSTFMGFWGTYIMIAIPIDIVAIIYSFFNAGVSFLTTNVHLGIFLVAIFMTIFGFISVVRGPKVVSVDIPYADLPIGLNNLKIAQISDLHIGPTIQSRYVKRVVRKTNELNPDIIVITGDLVDAHTESIKKHLRPLEELKSRYGIFYVTGNHEYYWGTETLFNELRNVGLTILDNENKIIEINGSNILIAGIPDPMAMHLGPEYQPDLKKARFTKIKTDFNILLAHRPDPYSLAEEQGFHLQFSGHTHAGQFFPFSLLIPFAHKFYRGLNRHKNMWLYVNPGTGYWGPANRFGIASEITLAKLIKT